jgi:hypothetical protein
MVSTRVYGPNSFIERRLIWDKSNQLVECTMVCGGNFNVICFPIEQVGDEGFSFFSFFFLVLNGDEGFTTAMHDIYFINFAYGLLDIPLEGWFNLV